MRKVVGFDDKGLEAEDKDLSNFFIREAGNAIGLHTLQALGSEFMYTEQPSSTKPTNMALRYVSLKRILAGRECAMVSK